MYDNIINNLKKVIKSILPIIFFVIILSLNFKIDLRTIIRFLCSSIMIIIGLTLFTTGTDLSLAKMGKNISNSLIKKKNIKLILLVSFLIGTSITLLEPEFLTIGMEAQNIPTNILLITISLGIGISLMIAILRILFNISYRYFLISSYLLIFLILMLGEFASVPFAFDIGSVVVGAISAPFILSFGGNFANLKKNKKKDTNEFGILSLCSLGPIIMILILSLIYHPTIIYDSDPILKKLEFFDTLKTNFYQVFMSLIALVLIYFGFNIKNKNKKENKKILLGLIMVIFGITLFLTGGDVGYFKISYMIGSKLSGINYFLIILIGGIFGFLIAKIEPSVKVLITYVDEVTSGSIKEKFLEICLCFGVAISIMLSLFRVLNGYHVLMFLIPSYFLAILLAFFTPSNFLGMAFDAGGVVAGSIAASFTLPLLIGAASLLTNDYLKEAFGVMSLISVIPVIILEIVGIIYKIESKENNFINIDDTIIEYR